MHKVKKSKKLEQEVNSKVKLKYTQYKTKFYVPKPHCLVISNFTLWFLLPIHSDTGMTVLYALLHIIIEIGGSLDW